MDRKERAKVIREMVADPDKVKREMRENALRENPKLTEEQIEAAWRQVAQQFGL